MLAYITAQYCDVQLFHFWKRITKGKHLWIRNNFTLLSQMVDSIMVVTVTFGAAFLRDEITFGRLLFCSNYLFKASIALLVRGLVSSYPLPKNYLKLAPNEDLARSMENSQINFKFKFLKIQMPKALFKQVF